MRTKLSDAWRDTPEGQDAERELRKCVHCGFCNATCPTYQLLGDELDGPRGRIYLVKEMLEGQPATVSTRTHLDRCLTCRACETTCPANVKYGRLLEIGREIVDAEVPRPAAERLKRESLTRFVTSGAPFAAAVAVGRRLRPLLPESLQRAVPQLDAGAAPTERPTRSHGRKVVLLEGCAQSTLLPALNAATARVFDAVGIETLRIPAARCCGALRLHTTGRDGGLVDVRRGVDAWSPMLETPGVEAFVSNASGCGVTLRDWGRLLAGEPAYAARAAAVSARVRDPVELLGAEPARLVAALRRPLPGPIAFQSPCTLQHGLAIRGTVEALLRALGADVRVPADSHLCCGSAGSYSVLEPELSSQLRERKLDALAATSPRVVASANVGCIVQLQGAAFPVRHWIEIVADCL